MTKNPVHTDGLVKMLRTCLAAAAAAVVLSCAAAHDDGDPPFADSGANSLTLKVGITGGPTILSKAEVVLVQPTGILPLGETDRFGEIDLDKTVLRKSYALLVCSRGFFCGALRLDDEELYRFDHYYIELTAQALR